MVFDFAEDEGVLQYIQWRRAELSILPPTGIIKVAKLSGGIGNYVYRLTFQDGETCVLKQFPPYAAGRPSFALSDKRYFAERQALSLAQQVPDKFVRCPKVLYSDDEQRVIIMADIGANAVAVRDLLQKQHEAGMPHQSCQKVLNLCPHVFRYLNQFAALSDQVCTTDPVYENKAARDALHIVYDHLSPVFTQFFSSSQWVSKWKSLSGFPLTLPKDPVLVFGDFHPYSLFLDESKEFLWLLDWEFARCDVQYWDVLQWVANLWVMSQSPDHFYVNETVMLLQASIKAWRDCNPRLTFSEDYVDAMEARFAANVIRLLPFEHWGIKPEDYDKITTSLLTDTQQLFKQFRNE